MQCSYDIRMCFKYVMLTLIILLLFVNFFLIYKLNMNTNKCIKEQNSIKNEITLMTETMGLIRSYLEVPLHEEQKTDFLKQLDLFEKNLFDKKKVLEQKEKK